MHRRTKAIQRFVAAVLTLLAVGVGRADGVDVSSGGGGAWHVHARAYDATVEPDGSMTHLSIGGEEMLNSSAGISRGTYFYQGGRLTLEGAQASDNAISAGNLSAAVTYRFTDGGITVTAANRTASAMLFFFILDAKVRAATGDLGEHVTTPAAKPWSTATFYRDRATLKLAGANRIWGPWAGLQVWEAFLQPNETRTITATPGTVSAEDDKWLAELAGTKGQPVAVAPVRVWSPREYQVVQRQSTSSGRVRVSGRVAASVHATGVESHLTGRSAEGVPLSAGYQPISFTRTTGCFDAELTVPAGGWYGVEVRTVGGDHRESATVEHVGVGEVFVIAGQSNSTNNGQVRTVQHSGQVSSFDGGAWRLADDPQPGPHDGSTGGSPWPAFGDAMVARYHVPIGIASTGHGGTSITQWSPGGELFNWTTARIQQLGPGGFRAVLWHQGESDWGMPATEYADRLTAVVLASQRSAGWAFPWFVAHASYHNAKDNSDPAVRAGQAMLWTNGTALEGPDTDRFGPDYRDNNGAGIHFAPRGLAAHGQAWAEKVAVYLDPILGAKP